MGRTQSYDRAQVVREARQLFWRVGYEGAGLAELEQVTGLSRSSIYHAFGSKRGLYDEAVQSYLDEVVRPRLRPLVAEGVAPGAILGYLSGLAEALLVAPAVAGGCLLINSATGGLADDPEVARVVADYRAELRSALLRGVSAYLPQRPAEERGTLADAVTGLVVSAFALARVAPREAAAGLGTAADLLRATASRR